MQPSRLFHRLPTAIAALALLGLATVAPALDFHIDGYGGVLNGSSDTKPVERRAEVGVLADVTPPLFPVAIAANVFFNRGKSDDLTVTGRELQVGLAKTIDIIPIVHPFLGGGVTVVNGVADSDSAGRFDGRAIGPWAYGGVRVDIGLLDLGALVGWSQAKVDLDNGGDKVDMGGVRIGGFAGIAW